MSKNSSNDWELSIDGYNYLKEKQINRFKRNNESLNNNIEQMPKNKKKILIILV